MKPPYLVGSAFVNVLKGDFELDPCIRSPRTATATAEKVEISTTKESGNENGNCKNASLKWGLLTVQRYLGG